MTFSGFPPLNTTVIEPTESSPLHFVGGRDTTSDNQQPGNAKVCSIVLLFILFLFESHFCLGSFSSLRDMQTTRTKESPQNKENPPPPVLRCAHKSGDG